jgi:hypothetical protein
MASNYNKDDDVPTRETNEELKRVIREMDYDSRECHQVYLQGAELLMNYAETLQKDGRVPRKEQIQICNDMVEVCSLIMKKVSEAKEKMQLIRSK